MRNIIYTLLLLIVMIQLGCTNSIDQTSKSVSNTSTTSVSTSTTSSVSGAVEDSSALPSEVVSINSNSSSGKLIGNCNNNMVFGGRIAKDGDWLYFSLDSLQQDSIGLCRMKSDGSNFSVLVNDWSKCFNVSKDYLYYIKTHDGWASGDICRIKKDGTEEKKLSEGEYINLLLVGNKLYFTCMSDDYFAYNLYRMNIDGTQKELFIQDKCDANFLYCNGYIYIVISDKKKDGSFDAALSKININNKQKELIAHNFNTVPAFLNYPSFYISKNKILYISDKDHHIYSMYNNGKWVKKLNNIDANTMVISEEDNKIYCFSWKMGLGTIIYSFNLDGKNIKKITTLDNYSYIIGIEDDYLYFNEEWGEGNITNNGRIKTNGSDFRYLVDYVKDYNR